MIFSELDISGAFVVDLEPHADDRGFFARAKDRDELIERGLTGEMWQANIGFSPEGGDLSRGCICSVRRMLRPSSSGAGRRQRLRCDGRPTPRFAHDRPVDGRCARISHTAHGVRT